MSVNNQHINPENKYLYILWVIGIILFTYLCIPFVNKDSGMYLPDLIQSGKIKDPVFRQINKMNDKETENEALIFVTVNKKKLLTKFVAYLSDDELRKKQISDTLFDKDEKSFIIIGKKKSIKQSRKKEDFSIKHAPEI